MIKHSFRRAAALAVAATALAAPAAQADPADMRRLDRQSIPPPEGQVEHVVRKFSFTGDYRIPGVVPREQRIESWVASDRTRNVQTDWATGELRTETVQSDGTLRVFQAADNEIVVYGDAPRRAFVGTLAEQGVLIRQQVEKGWFVKTGETTHLGRPAIVLEASESAPTDVEDHRHTVIADAETYAPYVRTVSGRSGENHRFTQHEEVVSAELVPRQESDLQMSPHPGARTVTPGAKAAKASKAAARRKAAKRRALARRAAARPATR